MYIVKLRRYLTNLWKNLRKCIRITLKHCSELLELRKILKVFKEIWWMRVTWRLTLRVLRNSVEKVLDCSLSISKSCSKCSYALLSRESHSYEVIDLSLWRFWDWLRVLFFFFRLWLFLFFFFALLFFFNFGFVCRFLSVKESTETWVMKTRKSVYLIANF